MSTRRQILTGAVATIAGIALGALPGTAQAEQAHTLPNLFSHKFPPHIDELTIAHEFITMDIRGKTETIHFVKIGTTMCHPSNEDIATVQQYFADHSQQLLVPGVCATIFTHPSLMISADKSAVPHVLEIHIGDRDHSTSPEDIEEMVQVFRSFDFPVDEGCLRISPLISMD